MDNQSAPDNQQSVINNESLIVNNEPANNNKRTNRLTALAFMEIGLFEIVFVIVGVLLLLGTINYFNLLPVSEVFPKYLGWLPRQTKIASPGTGRHLASQGETLEPQNNPINYSPISSPTPQGQFQYDAKNAETLLTQYIENEIKSEFLPETFDIRQGLVHGKQTDIGYQFGSSFTVNSATVSANFHFKENINQQNDSNIFVKLEIPTVSKATASLANSLLSSYFINPFPVSTCQTKGVKSYCENFQSLSDGNKGYGILLGYDNARPSASIVFTCFIPKNSTYYSVLKSCISP